MTIARPSAADGRQRPPRFTIDSGREQASTVAVLASVRSLPCSPRCRLSSDARSLQDLFFVFTMLALAQYWNLLAGYAGLVSIGQQAFIGLGAYALFAATLMAGLDPLIAILIGGIVAAVLALPTALVVFRLRGAYFAIGTWVAAEVFRLILAQVKQLGGGTGTSLGPDITNDDVRSRMDRRMFGVRISGRARHRQLLAGAGAARRHAGAGLLPAPLAARPGARRDPRFGDGGRQPRRRRLSHQAPRLCLTAFGTGMVGALIYLQKARISPDAAFSVLDWTAYVIFIVVIGGIGTIEGPIIGAIVLLSAAGLSCDFGTWYLMLLGALAIVIMLSSRRACGASSPSATTCTCSRSEGGSRWCVRMMLGNSALGSATRDAPDKPTLVQVYVAGRHPVKP